MLQGCTCVIIIGWCMTIFNRAPIEDTAKVAQNNARCKSLRLDDLTVFQIILETFIFQSIFSIQLGFVQQRKQ